MSTSLTSQQSFSLMHAAGVLAWALVSWVLWQANADSSRPIIALASTVFLFGFLYATHDARLCAPHASKRLALVLQYVSAVTLLLLTQDEVAIILLIVAMSQLPWFVGMTASITVVALSFAGHVLLKVWVWQSPQAFISPLLYASFMLFAVFSSYQARREQRSREDTQHLMNELKATQHLLSDAAREAERLQIARDLHDTMGHHLTALALQLEIAGHLTEGEAKTQVEKARQLAKLLLADVRATVSDLRERHPVDLRTALQTLIDGVPGLTVALEFPDDVAIHEPAQAEVLLRAAQELVTNALRHAQASRLTLKLNRHDQALWLTAEDDGRGTGSAPRFGNGLTGLRERLQALGGTLAVSTAPASGFRVEVRLPDAKP